MSSDPMVRFASQTYSWQMSGNWAGRLNEIVRTVAASGFEGIEPEVCMTGGYETATQLRGLLLEHGVELAALTLVLDWQHPGETASERQEADRVIEVLRHFPGARLVLVQSPSDRWTDRALAQDNLLTCLTAVAHRAADAGLTATFHPNSPRASIVRERSDYDRVLPRLPSVLGWTPDTGHLAVGGMDPLELIGEYRELINHVHLKDADRDGRWTPNGTGSIAMDRCVALLAATGYEGWVVLEDESPQAEADPAAAAVANREYVRTRLAPIISRGDVS